MVNKLQGSHYFLAGGTILFLASFLGSSIWIPGQRVKFERLSVEQGLSQSVVNCIIQDHLGFLWFGTQDGLNKYDGYSFLIYKNDLQEPNSLSSNDVLALYEDGDGDLWLGTRNGLNCFHPQQNRFQRFRHIPGNDNSLSHDTVWAICGDIHEKGVLWLGTERGLDRYDRRRSEFRHYRYNPNNAFSIGPGPVRALYMDRRGFLWIGNQGGGMSRLNPIEGSCSRFRKDPRQPNSLMDDNIYSLAQARDGVIWIGTENGLCAYDPEREWFKNFRHDPDDPKSLGPFRVQALIEDSSGNLWVGCWNGGVNRLQKETGIFENWLHKPEDIHSLGGNFITTFFEDRSGILWIGTSGGGVSKYDPRLSLFPHFTQEPGNPNGLADKFVWCFFEDARGDLWVGTDDGGLNKLERRSGRFTHYKNDPRNPGSISCNDVRAINTDRDGSRIIWVGTARGLNRFDTVKEKFTLFPFYAGKPQIPIMCQMVDRSGKIWLGTMTDGMFRLDPNGGPVVHYRHNERDPGSLINDTVNSIFKDSRGWIWVGTYDGLDRLDLKEQSFTHFRHDPDNSNSLSYNSIGAIGEDREGTIWVGTLGGGVNRLDTHNNRYIHYTERNGLSNNYVYGLLIDDNGEVWISTNRGLSRLNPKTGKIRNYDTSDGLQSLEFDRGAFYKSTRGELLFGGINGFNVFYPQSIKDNPYIPPVVITDFQLFNKSVGIGGDSPLKKDISFTRELQLSWWQNYFSFSFVALNYLNTAKNQYAYMLEGLDRDWNYIGDRRFVTYSAVPPGRYVFRVKGSNNNGVWNEKGAALVIIITPPFWKTWWFTLLLVAALGLILAEVYHFRVHRLAKHKAELELVVVERTRKLKLAMDELERLSLTDPLTQLPNRRNFELIFAQEWKRCSREVHPLSLLMLDIDFFKSYNDTYGHPLGDDCLKKVAAAISRCTSRAGDFVARLGGEEFIIILPNTPAPGAALIAERVRSEVEGLKIPHLNSKVSSVVTISVGVVTTVPERDKPSDHLILSADQALYQAKKEGRNRVAESALG